MNAAKFAPFALAMAFAAAGCSAFSLAKTVSGTYLFGKMLARCDNGSNSGDAELCREQARREYEAWARIHPLQ